MKTETLLPESLVHVLENLSDKTKNFEEIVLELFSFDFDDYNQLFSVDHVEVDNHDYLRIPVFRSENCVVNLRIWGIDHTTAIHDHNNYEGRIKVLKGSLSEVSYRENSNFIEYNGVTTFHENDVFPEEEDGIHSLINNSDEISVSLHIYRTSEINHDGVKVFDTEERKVGWLNEKAVYCSWDLPADCYNKIEKV